MTVTLIILTLNERDCLPSVLPHIPRSSVDEIIVIDGGSTDGTQAYCAEQGLRVIVQEKKGRGEAFKAAMEHTTTDALVYFSPDGNEDPKDIPRLRTALEQGYDIVIASRMMAGAHNEEDDHVFRPRKWANNALNALANVLFRRKGPWITDSINGFRAIRRNAWNALSVDAPGFAVEYQMTIRAFKHQLRIKEIPTREGQRIAGKTKAPSLRTGISFLRLLAHEYIR